MYKDSSDLSDLTSLGSMSPSPPPGVLPSPPPSQDAEDSSAARGQDDMTPARKKRRVTPKERRTELLDLSSDELSYAEQQSQIDLLTKTLHRHRKIVVIAGAGISTSAGIPDFRSSDGLFKSLQKKHNLKASGKLLFDAAVYQDESLTASFHEMVRSLSQEAAKTSPTAFHHMLARLSHENRLMRLYTQNIDGIETAMPPLATQIPLNNKAPWPRTIQLHGSLEKMVCQKCRYLADFEPGLFDGPEAPLCPACAETDAVRATTGQRSHGVGKMRPRMVLYNEHNPDEEAIASVMNADIRSRPDALIVVGTSMKIPGVRRLVKSLCKVIRGRRNGVTMWINNQPPVGKEFEDCFDLMVKGDCEEVARLAGLKKWDDKSEDVFTECNDSEIERVKKEQGPVSIVIPTKKTPTKRQKTQIGFLTPTSSVDDEESSELPHKKASKGSRANPAGQGRKLFPEAFKEPKKATTTRRKNAPKSKKQEAAKNSKITEFSQVTKRPVANSRSGKKGPNLDKIEVQKHELLPASAARINAISPNPDSKGNVSAGAGVQISPETISPRSKPRGMDDYID